MPRDSIYKRDGQMIEAPTIAETLDKILDVWANPNETQPTLQEKGETDERFNS